MDEKARLFYKASVRNPNDILNYTSRLFGVMPYILRSEFWKILDVDRSNWTIAPIIHGPSGKSTSFPKRETWFLGMWMEFWFPHSKTFSKFLHWCRVLKFGYGRLKPLQETSDILFASLREDSAGEPWTRNSYLTHS